MIFPLLIIIPESVKLNMEKHNYAALMQCFLSNLNPDILTQQVNLFLESCFHSLLPFGSSQHYSEPLQGDALFPRASPLQKQSTGLFLNSPLAERFVTVGLCPHTPPEALPLTLPVRPLCPSDISPSYGESLCQRNTVPLESHSWARQVI